MTLKRSIHLSLVDLSDADWGRDQDDRRSVTGYCIFLGSNAVAWSSKKQRNISCSSTELEYWSLANASVEVI